MNRYMMDLAFSYKMKEDSQKTYSNIYQEDIASYVEIFKTRQSWFNFKDEPKTFYFFVKKMYTYSRPFLFLLCFIVTIITLAKSDDFGFSDGSIIFLELWFHLMSMTLIFWGTQKKHEKLVEMFSYNFKVRDGTKLRKIRTGTLKKLTKMINIGLKLDNYGTMSLIIIPMVVDTVLHHGFGMLDEPLTLPSPFESILGPFKTWNAAYYLNFPLTLWFVWSLLVVHQAQVLGYLLLITYSTIELRKFKSTVKALRKEKRRPVIRRKLRRIFQWHQDFTELKTHLKDYLGLPCAFNYLLITINMTLLLFCSAISKEKEMQILYALSVVCYFSIGLLYGWLGQMLEDKNTEVYETIIYELPWYEYTPAVRKDLLMLIRQAQFPLVIDYYGGSVMNLASFKDMISQTYSCFTLIHTMATEE